MMAATPMDESGIDREEVLAQLERMLSSAVFRRAERSSTLLRFIVEQALNGRSDSLKEYTLGVEALARGESFDPRTDPVVRAEASRLRTRLEQYYETIGRSDPVVVRLPKGTYVPEFTPRPASNEEAASRSEVRNHRRPRSRTGGNQWLAWSVAIAAIALATAAWIRGRPHDRHASSVCSIRGRAEIRRCPGI